MMFKITTERLLLRQFTAHDHKPLMNVFGDEQVMRFGDGVQSAEWVQTWLEQCINHHYPSWGFGPYAVVKKQARELIGYCGLFLFPDGNGQPEIELGYRLSRRAWGNGYASEAAKAVRNFAFSRPGIQRLIAMIDPANMASIRVAEKIGMHYEKDVIFEGYTHPDHIYVVHSTGK
jgi:RimJ/RimL family protein N-acetyltransferase